MIKLISLTLFLFVSAAQAKEVCTPQSIEILKNDKTATYIDCYIVNQKPLTMVTVQIFNTENQGRKGLTLSAYEYAFNFSPTSKPIKIQTRLAEDILPFMYNQKLVQGSVYADVDEDGQKEIVFNGYVAPKLLHFYIVSWNEKARSFEMEGRSNFAEEDIPFFIGANLNGSEFRFPQLDTKKKTLLIPFETYSTEHNSQFYKTYKLVGPLYVEEVK